MTVQRPIGVPHLVPAAGTAPLLESPVQVAGIAWFAELAATTAGAERPYSVRGHRPPSMETHETNEPHGRPSLAVRLAVRSRLPEDTTSARAESNGIARRCQGRSYR
jgi:hypothetical protein